MFKPCIIIPVYNHGQLLLKSIGKIEQLGYPIIIVDDGNKEDAKKILEQIAAANQQINLIRLEQNQGKGAAVCNAFLYAAKNGYSHALQIDADGQHNISDIEIFFQLAKDNPDCLINGIPVYDESVPKARLYSRKITNFWVMVETLSCDIKDAMCGFRVYPLAAVERLLQKRSISPRMGFDIEIIVRLHWMGVKIINQPTKVIYPADGISNFRMVADNIRISWTHTKLFFGMVVGRG